MHGGHNCLRIEFMDERKVIDLTPGKRIHFGWLVVLMCLLIQGAAFGIVTNTRGLFFEPMCSELGVQLGELTRCCIFYAAAAFRPA